MKWCKASWVASTTATVTATATAAAAAAAVTTAVTATAATTTVVATATATVAATATAATTTTAAAAAAAAPPPPPTTTITTTATTVATTATATATVAVAATATIAASAAASAAAAATATVAATATAAAKTTRRERMYKKSHLVQFQAHQPTDHSSCSSNGRDNLASDQLTLKDQNDGMYDHYHYIPHLSLLRLCHTHRHAIALNLHQCHCSFHRLSFVMVPVFLTLQTTFIFWVINAHNVRCHYYTVLVIESSSNMSLLPLLSVSSRSK